MQNYKSVTQKSQLAKADSGEEVMTDYGENKAIIMKMTRS